MATVKAEELRARTADELKTQLVELKKEQFNLNKLVTVVHTKGQPDKLWHDR